MKQSQGAIFGVRDSSGDDELAASRSRSKLGLRWVGVALGVAVGAGIVLLTNPGGQGHREAPSVVTGTDLTRTGHDQPTESAASAGLVEYADRKLGLSVAYPRTWQRVDSSATSLVLRISGGDAVSIRQFTLDSPIDASNLADVRAVTDGILEAPKAELTMLQTEQVKVQNLIGVYYLYYFPFEGGQGVHAHYFLFKGRVMYSLVFQADSASRFEELAPTFDAVSASFRAIDG